MPYYGRITEAGIGGEKAGAHQGVWKKPTPHHLEGKRASPGGMVSADPTRRPHLRQVTSQDQKSQIGAVPGMKPTIPIPEETEEQAANGLNGNGSMDGGADLDLSDVYAVGAELAADAEEAEECGWTVTEAEAHMIQMELDAEARKKRRFWELLLAVGGGFVLGKMWKA